MWQLLLNLAGKAMECGLGKVDWMCERTVLVGLVVIVVLGTIFYYYKKKRPVTA